MSDNGKYLTAFKLRKKVSKHTRDEYFVGFWGPLKVVVVRSVHTADDGSEFYNVIFQQTEEPRPRLAVGPTRSERARVNEPLDVRPLFPAPNDSLPF